MSKKLGKGEWIENKSLEMRKETMLKRIRKSIQRIRFTYS